MEEKKMIPGTIYTDSKDGKKYQIVTLAKEKNTEGKFVIYQALFEPFETFAESVETFMQVRNGENTENDAINKSCEETEKAAVEECSESENNVSNADSKEADIHPMFRRFLDASGYSQRIEILKDMRDIVDDTMINSMAVIMDMEIKEGPIEERYDELLECMHMKHRYEIERY